MLVGDDVTLECEVNTPEAPVTWAKDGKVLKGKGKKLKIEKDGCVHRLVIKGATPAQAAAYTASVGDDTTKSVLTGN